MACLHGKAEAELKRMDRALGLLPDARKVSELSVLEPAGTAWLLPNERAQVTTIQAQVPDPLAKQIEELARQENVSVDQLVSIVLE